MNEETRDIGFTGDIKIPREIKDIKAEVFAGLDIREIKIIGMGVILAAIVALICFGLLKMTGSVATMAPAVALAPFVIVAKIKKNNMNLEDWFMVYYSGNFKGKPIRVNELTNQYEKLEQIYHKNIDVKKKEGKEDKKKAKQRKKELKVKMKNSQYHAIY